MSEAKIPPVCAGCEPVVTALRDELRMADESAEAFETAALRSVESLRAELAAIRESLRGALGAVECPKCRGRPGGYTIDHDGLGDTTVVTFPRCKNTGCNGTIDLVDTSATTGELVQRLASLYGMAMARAAILQDECDRLAEVVKRRDDADDKVRNGIDMMLVDCDAEAYRESKRADAAEAKLAEAVRVLELIAQVPKGPEGSILPSYCAPGVARAALRGVTAS